MVHYCQSVFTWHLPQLYDWLPFCALLVSCQCSDSINRQHACMTHAHACTCRSIAWLTVYACYIPCTWTGFWYYSLQFYSNPVIDHWMLAHLLLSTLNQYTYLLCTWTSQEWSLLVLHWWDTLEQLVVMVLDSALSFSFWRCQLVLGWTNCCDECIVSVCSFLMVAPTLL